MTTQSSRLQDENKEVLLETGDPAAGTCLVLQYGVLALPDRVLVRPVSSCRQHPGASPVILLWRLLPDTLRALIVRLHSSIDLGFFDGAK